MSNISAQLIQDSEYRVFGKAARITTFILEYPRFIHSEFMTHRDFSRNAASSRAIPVYNLIDQTRLNPVYPVYWGKEQSGMVAGTELSQDEQLQAKKVWRQAANDARKAARRLTKLMVHKQIANRVLECFQHIKVMVTATNFANFFALRNHADAQPEIKVLAEKMWEQYQASEPMRLKRGEWHLPFIERKRAENGKLLYLVDNAVVPLKHAKKVSASAAAQTSYRKEDLGITKALNIFERLASATPVHASPFEHQATPMLLPFLRSRNFRGWRQFRTEIPNETVYELPKAA